MCCLGGADGYACKTERGWQVLMATGRKAKTKDIGLEEISVELDEKGGVKVLPCTPLLSMPCVHAFRVILGLGFMHAGHGSGGRHHCSRIAGTLTLGHHLQQSAQCTRPMSGKGLSAGPLCMPGAGSWPAGESTGSDGGRFDDFS